jgi:HD-GYP domain-containing protein (c-di-GMP phosphodiesterase class II)
MLLYRNRYLAGRISYRECHDALIELYERRDPNQYDLNGIYDNLQLPLEAICQLDHDHLSPDDLRRLDAFYREVIRYAFHMPNSGSLSSMLEFFQGIIDRFIEVPGGLSFEEMALQCLAALHPPTYVHSMMVAKLSSYLCQQLIERDPKWLIGAPGCESALDVVANRSALIDFTFHAARCHDVGKLSIIDTIFVYGRNLFDTEFELIRTHPRTGYDLLDRHDSTRPYRDVALGHHRWYDNSRGYPEDFDTRRSSVKPIIDIVLCADCLDAATDSVGRSYRRGKTLEDFIAEVLPECGAHYPPWLAELLKDPETTQGLRDILQEGRRETYQNTYGLLSQMNEA